MLSFKYSPRFGGLVSTISLTACGAHIVDGSNQVSGRINAIPGIEVRRARRERETDNAVLKVLVVGGGPAGLAFATSAKAVMGKKVEITVREGRWKAAGTGIVWKGLAEGVNRREQVVTIQSAVAARLPEIVRDSVFPVGGGTRMWPTGGESPATLGHPVNVRIMDIEDRLLALANRMDIALLPSRVDPEELTVETYDLVVIADGASSRLRKAYVDRFGKADPAPYSVHGQQLVDTVLGLRITTGMADADQVLMTIAQQRFLANTANGEGCLYMRLTPEEALEVRGRNPNGSAYVDCIQSNPCVMQASGAGGHLCPTHGTRFVPAEDPSSFLWPRVLEGLALFNVPLSALHGITAFRLSMEHRPRFTAELTPTGSPRPVFGALIGDAANAIHFWVGRGLNHGFSSAVSLVRALAGWRSDRPLRSANFTRHEAAMHALQHRHKDRAWRNMAMQRDGATVPIAEVISGAMAAPREARGHAVVEMRRRLTTLEARLARRLPGNADIPGLMSRVEALDPATLSMFVEAGTWEMTLSGGPETDLEELNPKPAGIEGAD
ncbi:hypothetical protein OO012_14980 [Rhodobacteraceae bacterium KMM 6894]|nr:hypothetical protein [Rhodobacteraceae bacterium KMM 6894]